MMGTYYDIVIQESWLRSSGEPYHWHSIAWFRAGKQYSLDERLRELEHVDHPSQVNMAGGPGCSPEYDFVRAYDPEDFLLAYGVDEVPITASARIGRDHPDDLSIALEEGPCQMAAVALHVLGAKKGTHRVLWCVH
jgi:hypothetical protein